MLPELTDIHEVHETEDAALWNSQLWIPGHHCASLLESTIIYDITNDSTVGSKNRSHSSDSMELKVWPISTIKSTSETIIVLPLCLGFCRTSEWHPGCFPLYTAVWGGGTAYEQGCGKDDGCLAVESTYWLRLRESSSSVCDKGTPHGQELDKRLEPRFPGSVAEFLPIQRMIDGCVLF